MKIMIVVEVYPQFAEDPPPAVTSQVLEVSSRDLLGLRESLKQQFAANPTVSVFLIELPGCV